MEPEYPFEWGGIFQLEKGVYNLTMQPGPDPAMKAVLLAAAGNDRDALAKVEMDAVLTYSAEETVVLVGGTILPGKQLNELQLVGEQLTFKVEIPKSGAYALFTEHHPDEFQAKLLGPVGELKALASHEYKPDHEHDEDVTSVGITITGDLHEEKLNEWIRDLLMNHGPDIFRMKGVLSIKGDHRRFVFQGVHMLFDGRPDRPWSKKEQRHNALIFIGRKLDRAKLEAGFKACLV